MTVQDDRGLQAARARAYTLAETGKFHTINDVQQALIAEGWPNAAEALSGDYAREAVSERCRVAQAN